MFKQLQAPRDPSQTETPNFAAEPGKRPAPTTVSITWPSTSFAVRSWSNGLRATQSRKSKQLASMA